MALGGDILSKDGTGNVSIYGPDFKVWVRIITILDGTS